MHQDQHGERQGIFEMNENIEKLILLRRSSEDTKYLQKSSAGPEAERCSCGGMLIRNGYCFVCLTCGEGGCG